MGTGLVFSDYFAKHETGPGFPECPERISAIRDVFSQHNIFSTTTALLPFDPTLIKQEDTTALSHLRETEQKWITKNHAPEYLERLKAACANSAATIDNADVAICPDSYQVALFAVASVLHAADAVVSRDVNNAFCAVRPPGHHAEHNLSMGFCLFNNVAICARYLREKHRLSKILIFDWDVHHGNGTQHSFEEDPNVFFCSMHGHPMTLYPGTGFEEEAGEGPGKGFTLNIPLMPGAGNDIYKKHFEEKFLPAANNFAPDFVLISAGFDAHKNDPLGTLKLSTEMFGYLTEQMCALATKHCDGRLISLLEGGYNLNALGECAVEHVKKLSALKIADR